MSNSDKPSPDQPRRFRPPALADVGALDPVTADRLPGRGGHPDIPNHSLSNVLGIPTFHEGTLLVRRDKANEVRELLVDVQEELEARFRAEVTLHKDYGDPDHWEEAQDDFGRAVRDALKGKADSGEVKKLLALTPLRLRVAPAAVTGLTQAVDTWGVLQYLREKYVKGLDSKTVTAKRDTFLDARTKAEAALQLAVRRQAEADAAKAKADTAQAKADDLKELAETTALPQEITDAIDALKTAAGTAETAAIEAEVAAAEARKDLQNATDAFIELTEPISLDHVLFGPDTSGAPQTKPRGVEGAPQTRPRSLGGTPQSKPRWFDGTPHTKPREAFEGYRGTDRGRTPVAWVGQQPEWTDLGAGNPVVVVVDSGIGEHPWYETGVDRDPEIVPDGLRFSQVQVSEEEERAGTSSPDGLLSDASGHGTFIAGLVRQKCPNATLLSVRVLGNDNVADEAALARVLVEIAARQLVAKAAEEAAAHRVDVVTLSLGYYHEYDRGDLVFTTDLQRILDFLGTLGVVVVTAAGNDATATPLYPAAFAPWRTSPNHPPQVASGPDAAVPVVCVGALNPDAQAGGTVALFSNTGPHVTALRPGANLVSTMPVTFNGALTPAVSTAAGGGRVRAALDPDDYSGGFALWSGTSFAVGVLAGEVAAALAPKDGVTVKSTKRSAGDVIGVLDTLGVVKKR